MKMKCRKDLGKAPKVEHHGWRAWLTLSQLSPAWLAIDVEPHWWDSRSSKNEEGGAGEGGALWSRKAGTARTTWGQVLTWGMGHKHSGKERLDAKHIWICIVWDQVEGRGKHIQLLPQENPPSVGYFPTHPYPQPSPAQLWQCWYVICFFWLWTDFLLYQAHCSKTSSGNLIRIEHT